MLKVSIEYCVEHYAQLSKFISVGVITFAINFLLFHLFYGSFALNYKIATTLAYVLTVVCHFLLNCFFTFKAKDHKLSHSMGKYLLMLVLNYLLTLGVMWVIVNVVKISPYFGIIAATVVTAVSSFTVMKYFVFRFGHSKVISPSSNFLQVSQDSLSEVNSTTADGSVDR